MSYLLCEGCGVSFRTYGKPMVPGDQCPSCGGTDTHGEEDDEL